MCETGLIGTLCAAGTAQPFPLLACRQVSTFPGGGCAFPSAHCWPSAWAKAAGQGGQGTQLRHRIWPLCRDKHPRGAAGPYCSEQPECKGVREWAFSLALRSQKAGFPASSNPGCWRSNAVQEQWEGKAALDLAPFLQATHSAPGSIFLPQAAPAVGREQGKPPVKKGC